MIQFVPHKVLLNPLNMIKQIYT